MRELPSDVINLIYQVELDKAGWWEASVEVYTCVILKTSNKPSPIQQIRKQIQKQFNQLDISYNELEDALKRLVGRGEVIIQNDGTYALSVAKSAQMKEEAENSKRIEERAKTLFIKLVKEIAPELNAEMIWGLFISEFLIPLVTNEGARAYDVLVRGKRKTPPPLYVDNYIAKIQPESVEKQVFN